MILPIAAYKRVKPTVGPIDSKNPITLFNIFVKPRAAFPSLFPPKANCFSNLSASILAAAIAILSSFI